MRGYTHPYYGMRGGGCKGYETLVGEQVCDQSGYIGNCFASGSFYVHHLCSDANLQTCGDTLVKIVPITRTSMEAEIENEYKFWKQASDLRVTPTVHSLTYCTYAGQKYAIISSQRYGSGTLTQLFLTQRPLFDAQMGAVCRQLKALVDTLYDHGVDHGDFHSDNVLYHVRSDGTVEVKLIDFGLARVYVPGKPRQYVCELLTSNIDYLDVEHCEVRPLPRRLTGGRQRRQTRF